MNANEVIVLWLLCSEGSLTWVPALCCFQSGSASPGPGVAAVQGSSSRCISMVRATYLYQRRGRFLRCWTECHQLGALSEHFCCHRLCFQDRLRLVLRRSLSRILWCARWSRFRDAMQEVDSAHRLCVFFLSMVPISHGPRSCAMDPLSFWGPIRWS